MGSFTAINKQPLATFVGTGSSDPTILSPSTSYEDPDGESLSGRQLVGRPVRVTLEEGEYDYLTDTDYLYFETQSYNCDGVNSCYDGSRGDLGATLFEGMIEDQDSFEYVQYGGYAPADSGTTLDTSLETDGFAEFESTWDSAFRTSLTTSSLLTLETRELEKTTTTSTTTMETDGTDVYSATIDYSIGDISDDTGTYQYCYGPGVCSGSGQMLISGTGSTGGTGSGMYLLQGSCAAISRQGYWGKCSWIKNTDGVDLTGEHFCLGTGSDNRDISGELWDIIIEEISSTEITC
ncbi:MAG: hypothetical protein JRL30_30140 [Deltaproteobacteria bacterium]|nr:hypothetical protein [Deltaproteobacteria bacterium]